jgi:hypothetical protein
VSLGRMKIERVIPGLLALVLLQGATAFAETLNVSCPFNSTFREFDLAYHSCSNGHVKKNGSCSTFVQLFHKLIPKYDCARSFDTGPVPAVWLAEGGAVEDYVRLMYRLAIRDEPYNRNWFDEPAAEAKKLFGSAEFRTVLDGALAEDFLGLSEKVGAESKSN